MKSDFLHRTVLIRFGCISFLIGVALASIGLDVAWLPRSVELTILMLICAALFSSLRVRWGWYVGALLLGALWMNVYHELHTPPELPHAPMAVTGVVQYVDPLFNKQRLVVVTRLPALGRTVNVYVYTQRYPLQRVGSRIEFTCIIEKPQPIDTFAYDRFAARNGISYVCRYPHVRSAGFESSFRSHLFDIKEWYSRVFNRAFHEPENGLAQAMVLARTGELSPRLRSEFSRAGIVHVISISGLHMALLTMLAELLLQAVGVGRKSRLAIVAFFCLLYLTMLGFPAPAFRSALMVVLLLGARIVGRPSNGMHTLVLVATAMVLQNPYVLGFDIGFQLSFAALAGILVTSEFWEHMLRFLPQQFGLRAVAAMTFAAQFFIWPLTAYYFGTVSLVAPLANIAVAALLGPVLVGALIIPLSFMIPLIAPLIVWPTFFMLKALVVAAHYASEVPFAVMSLPSLSVPFLILSYSAVFVFYHVCIAKKALRTYAAPYEV